MKYTTLGNTDIKVSKICLGTMTWGRQNNEKDAHEQLGYAFEQGVNFIDTAEMYAVPASEESQGKTEEFIGSWIQKRGSRNDFVLATKIVGPHPNFTWIREGKTKFVRDIKVALEGSLKRLKTDYIDLYQLHWPERKSNFFGQLGYQHDASDEWNDNILEVLQELQKAVNEGKIRQVGLSNETAWGIMKYINTAEHHDLPRMVSVQNPYSLLNRSYEVGAAEVSIRENCGLLAYSPLAFGVLSGKYLNNQQPEGARLSLFPNFKRYSSPRSTEAVERYLEVANKHNVSLAQLSLAFVNERPFVTSNIIGATTLEQLKKNINSVNVLWNDELEKDINQIHADISNPAP